MRVPYKIQPLQTSHPAFPRETSVWVPVLEIRITYPAKHSPPTRRFEALVDSGAPECYFHADIGSAIGIRADQGTRSDIGGIVSGASIPVYYHDIGLYVATDLIRIKAGFSDQLSVAAILGRRGFFEHFTVTFDPANNPPGLEINRLARA